MRKQQNEPPAEALGRLVAEAETVLAGECDSECWGRCRRCPADVGHELAAAHRALLAVEAPTRSQVYWKLAEDPSWRPYCLNCRTMARMTRVADGFRCEACKLKVGLDMRAVEAPPLSEGRKCEPLNNGSAMHYWSADRCQCGALPAFIDSVTSNVPVKTPDGPPPFGGFHVVTEPASDTGETLRKTKEEARVEPMGDSSDSPTAASSGAAPSAAHTQRTRCPYCANDRCQCDHAWGDSCRCLQCPSCGAAWAAATPAVPKQCPQCGTPGRSF